MDERIGVPGAGDVGAGMSEVMAVADGVELT
jgi:hypothetical protein